MGMETSPTTALEAIPLAGIGTSPSIAPEALAPMGMETSPTTALEAIPLAGIGTSPSIAPEALAPMGMEASPTTALEQPQVSAVPEQAITEENMQTNVINVAPPVPVEKKHKAKEKIAMITPVTPITPAIQRIKIIHDIVVTPVPLIFKNNEAVLSKNAEEGLRRVADYMIEHRQLKLLILGYSDAYGPESYNKELSYYRTLWVKMALERYGVSSDRLMIKPMGKTNKFGHTKATEARNRRVVLSIAK
jgi:outer membrane protein OmpA-like peptidoglycan-associated protein